MTVKFAYETTPLHAFLINYFIQMGETINDVQENYFEIRNKEGMKRRFTYSPGVAAEDDTIELLAQGSRALKNIFNEAATKGSAAVLLFKESHDQVEEVVSEKWKSHSSCCEDCSQYGECTYGTCCSICPSRYTCHHLIQGSKLNRVDIKDQQLKLFFQLTFRIEILNPVRKQEELFQVLIDTESCKTFEPLSPKIIETRLFKPKEQVPMNLNLYDLALTHGYSWVESQIKGNVAFLRQQTIGSVSEKVTALKYRLELESAEEKSGENAYQKYEHGLKQLEKQYQINVEISLINALGIYIPEYSLEMYLENGTVVPVVFNPATNSVAHPLCTECGKEVLEGWACGNGHYVCGECADSCVVCDRVYCLSCSETMGRCVVCGELVCQDCQTVCSSCGGTVCKEHLYHCGDCGSSLCLLCLNTCKSCEKDLCAPHTKNCSCCNNAVCDDCSVGCSHEHCEKTLMKQHAQECSYCHLLFCKEHVSKTADGSLACPEHKLSCIKCKKEYRIDQLKPCAICGSPLCKTDQVQCYDCKIILCPEDTITCTKCQRKVCSNHTRKCKTCGKDFCLSHTLQCSQCLEWVCEDHVAKCSGCGRTYCSCTPMSTCELCGQQYCDNCLEEGMCPGCRSLVDANPSDQAVQHVKRYDRSVVKWNKWKIGKNVDTTIVIGLGMMRWLLFVISKDGKLIHKKDIPLLQRLFKRNLR